MKEVLLMIKVLLLMLLLCLIGIFLSGCRSHKDSVQVQAEASQSEHVERVYVGQSIFALFDSLNATHSIEADSLELEIFTLEIPSVDNDSLAAARPPRSDASGRLAARLSMKCRLRFPIRPATGKSRRRTSSVPPPPRALFPSVEGRMPMSTND